MFNIFATGKSGMSAYQEKLDYLSNDLVNSQTIAYKNTDVGFKDLLVESLDRQGTPLVTKTAVNGTGVKLGTNYAVNKQGNLKNTGIKTDLAIDDGTGQGYFALTQSDGSIAYTRNGNFKIDSNGVLVDATGTKVYINYEAGMSEGSPQLESEKISVDEQGGLYMNSGTDMVKIGTIPVFTAIGDKAFIPQGNSHFVPSADAQITQSTNYDIRQGFLEASTVDPTEVFSDVILTQRAFQLSSKAITAADDIWGMINNMRS
ncbi:flagellar hook-basal body complex protein [Clostridium saccharobutylicum]|uniref:Flagellar basal-body rod protein FlgG n=1 Tax=Clostridium saccharobutylicum DSM 13864 TaxID=1345695 RepID=U5MWI4_CLOSA|nr:flagellar hook-basal body complex protein [Clostridium saccharobutylicum]AGX44873.1 flagellar basal-body rod protein FlgG [Clostridium saccharobutylicum DSM 13864]AQR92155.1 flagellar basal-body rod protein FlgG [Clostridium saccharobutylicum]AQS02057.1 flagellar basal-body rod protein FlgG [Clostridium saccharobutylicum]AQS11661.1 flagellar basal-body rod protein FlgG [Clostridium saccharobutylicum]AQS16040.1 flagellar basal-body rod protein FlgG [Clostridium saccharobutylicum]